MITLSKSGNAVKFTFDENDHYLQNGTIEVPVNSLALIMDDSDMVTFRKSASNDIFVSANYSEFGMSKAELEAWYKTYMVGSSGGGGGTGGTTPEEVQEMIDASLIPYSTTSEVDSMIDESVSGKADTSAVDALNNTVTAHTADTTIHVTANEKAAWNNKSDFSGDYNDLTNKPTIPTVPTSNTAFTNDAGYITVDAISGKVDTTTYDTYTAATDNTLASKADTATTYTKTEVDNAITAATSTKQDTLVSGTNIKTINNESLLGNGNIDIQGGGSSYTAGDGIDITNDVISVTGKADTTAVTQSINEAVSGKANSADIVDITGFALQNSNTLVMTREKNGTTMSPLTVVKAGSGLTVTTDTMANKAFDVDTTVIQEKLISSQNIKTVNNESILGSGNIEIQGGGGMTEDDELLLATALTDLNDRKIDVSEVRSNYQRKGDYATKSYVTTALEPYETKLEEINTEEVTAYALNELNERLIALETAVQALQALHNNE